MSLKILLVAATESEMNAAKNIPGMKFVDDWFNLGKCEIFPLVTGVGSMAVSWALIKWFSAHSKPDLALNIGIAGSFREDIRTGDVVVPVSDCFADSGIETADGFKTLGEAGLQDPDLFPFKAGKIIPDNRFIRLASSLFRSVTAITVSAASGSVQTIDRLIKKYNPDIETMEGATFFYICSGESVPFLALRSISNRVEPRNKEKWNIPLALENLSGKTKELLMFL